MKRKKYSIILTAFILAVLYSTIPIMAQTGSICVHTDQLKEVLLVKVADSIEGEFILCSDYADIDLDLNQIKNAEQLNQAAERLSECTVGGTVLSARNSQMLAENLSTGAYLICDKNKEDSITFSPIIVQIPRQEEGSEKLMYHIEVQPKCVEIQEKNIPKTGDSSDFVLYTALILGSLIVLFLFVFTFILHGFGR